MNGKMEETFVDVINYIESQYRLVPEKSHRAIAGLSMGGFHSLHISRYYPKTFDYVGLFSRPTQR
jgi:enterochelin esterase family protein